MGTVIRFPAVARRSRRKKSSSRNAESATVIILPVIRIERFVDAASMPGVSRSQRRRRRRRASRS
jgi:hypothetical protein